MLFCVLILKSLLRPLVPTTVLCMCSDTDTAFPSRCCCPKNSALEVETFPEKFSVKIM